MDLRLIKNIEARHALGVGNTTFYEQIKAGLITPPVKLSTHSVAWPEHEIQRIVAARISGQSDEQIKALVNQLTEARKKLSAIVQGTPLHGQSAEVA